MDPRCGQFICEFLNNEVNALRESKRIRISIIENDIRYAIVFSGAVWAWILSRNFSPAMFKYVVSIIPTLVTGVFVYKWALQHRAITQIAGYILKVESQFGLGEGFGWEANVKEEKAVGNALKDHVDKIMIGLLLANTIGALLNISFAVNVG